MKVSVNLPDQKAAKKAVKKVKEKKAIPTLEESWQLIFSRKNSAKDLERLKVVKKFMEEGKLEREQDKLQRAFTKAEAMRLYVVAQEMIRKEKFKEMEEADLSLYPIITNDNIVDWTKRALNADNDYIAMDFETVGDMGGTDKYSEDIVGYSLTFRYKGVIENGYVPMRHRLEDGSHDPRNVEISLAENCIKGVFHGGKATVWHNASFDLGLVYASLGLEASVDVHDTLIIMHLLDENLPSYQLKKLATDFLKMPSDTFEELFGKNCKFADVPLMIARWYAAKDTHVGFLLFEWQQDILNKPNFSKIKKVYDKIERPCIMSTFQMEAQGFKIDMEEVKRQSFETKAELKDLEQELFERFGEVNWNSSSQLQKLLYYDNDWSEFVLGTGKSILRGHVGFDEHGISNNGRFAMAKNGKITLDPIVVREQVGFDSKGVAEMGDVVRPKNAFNKLSADSKALKKIAKHIDIIQSLLDYKDLYKHLTGFVESIDTFISPDGLLHGQFNQMGTVTLRYSASNPNLQQQPKKARSMFTAPDGSLIMGADFSQQEPRLLAHSSRCQALIDIYLEGRDLYSEMASAIFEKPIEECGDGSVYRKNTKMIVLAIMYGMGAPSLADILKISKEEAQKMIDDFFVVYPEIQEWIEKNQREVRINRYVETLWGTRRRFKQENFDILSKPWNRLSDYEKTLRSAANRAMRQTTNFKIQGGAAMQTKMVINAMRKRLAELSEARGEKLCFNFLAQVHDELLFKVPEDITQDEVNAIREVMEKTVTLVVPSKTDIELGKSWGHMQSEKDFFSNK